MLSDFHPLTLGFSVVVLFSAKLIAALENFDVVIKAPLTPFFIAPTKSLIWETSTVRLYA